MNYDPLQITLHVRLLGHSVLGPSTDRLEPEPEMLLKFQVVLSPVRSAVGRSKTATCAREAESTPWPSVAGRIMSFKISSNTIGIRTLQLSACNAVPRPMAPTRAPCFTNFPIHCSVSFLTVLSKVYKYYTRFLYILFYWTTLSQIHDLQRIEWGGTSEWRLRKDADMANIK
jgi:hypothetical protein